MDRAEERSHVLVHLSKSDRRCHPLGSNVATIGCDKAVDTCAKDLEMRPAFVQGTSRILEGVGM